MGESCPQRCIDIAVHDNIWLSTMTQDQWEDLLRRCYIATMSPNICTQSVSVCLTNDTEISLLNAHYRHKNMPTNVLAFPQNHNIDNTLGDIVLSYGVINQEAKNQQKKFIDHVMHLFVHGLLHLLGHDHIHEEEATKMESLEINILAALGVANPYE